MNSVRARSRRPLPLLCFIADLDGGGAQRSMANILNHLPHARFVPVLAAPGGDGPAARWLDEGIERVDLGCGRMRRALLPLRRLVRARRPALVFSTMVDANIVAAAALVGRAGAPALVVRETNSHRARGDLGPVRRAAAAWAYRRAARVVALSRGVERELTEDCRLEPSRVVTIHNPVDVDGLAASARAARAAPAPWTGRLGEGAVIVAAGRLTRQKGFDLLLDAFARLDAPAPGLVILGEGPDRAALEARAGALGVAARVLMPGFVDDPAQWYAHATLFVLSSRWEGFGHALVEAMACGIPAVATDCPHGPADILSDGEAGLLVRPGDAGALARAVSSLLADPPARARRARAGEREARRFAAPAIAARYAELFTAALAVSPGTGYEP
jgi:glycosyltransferase involved in cell wall biosynthesis